MVWSDLLYIVPFMPGNPVSPQESGIVLST